MSSRNAHFPILSSKAWCLVKNSVKVASKCDKMTREVASLTKIMTFYTALALMKWLDIDISQEVKITKACTWVGGTSARLKPGDTLTLLDLFHGLMLPSGNDAGLVISTYFGSRLIDQAKPKPDELLSTKSLFRSNTEVSTFIKEMNHNAWKLGLSGTFYDSPHGLNNP